MPLTYVLFGATGDLAQKKILPALCALDIKGTLAESFSLIAFSRRPWGDREYREFIKPVLEAFDSVDVEHFLARVRYVQGTFDDAASFATLRDAVTDTDVICHLAIEPKFYTQVVEHLGNTGLAGKILIEKPFGHDLASALELERTVEKYFSQENIFRVDHYLGKPGLDALDARLDGLHAASVSCSIFSTADVSERAEFYDTVGELRDVGQNHLLQMLAAVLADIGGAGVLPSPAARAEVFEHLTPELSTLERGQYAGYAQARGIATGSQTETYFKITAHSSSPRWQGVPLVLEAGKALGEKRTEIIINFTDGSQRLLAVEIPGGRLDYEVLVQDAMQGAHERFVSMDEVSAAWKFTDVVRARLPQVPLRLYNKGAVLQ